MSWPFTGRALTATDAIAERLSGRIKSGGHVSRKDAMSHSAVWAALRLRADLISSMPVDVFRRVDGVQVEVSKPLIMSEPGGPSLRWKEFVYSTQVDLDSCGNAVGVITARDGAGLPSQIELVNIDDVTFKGRGSKLTEVRVGKTVYDDPARQIWHEKQFTVSGLAIGLSPVAYAAKTINSYLSAQDFANDWFDNATAPGGHLKNVGKVIDKGEAQAIKANFKASVQSGDVWVSGNDWEYNMLAAKASESQFIETQQFSVSDAARFLGVPGDVIDAMVQGQSVTYANITQRNLQLLIMNIGPAIDRREDAFSYGLLPRPRYVKFNTAALLRMDTKSRMESHGLAISNRIYPPSRALDMENMPPLTPAEEAEFARLFPKGAPAPVSPGGSA